MRLKNLSQVLTAWMLEKGSGKAQISGAIEWKRWSDKMPKGYSWDGFQHMLREGYIKRTTVTTEYFELTDKGKKIIDRQHKRMMKSEAKG